MVFLFKRDRCRLACLVLSASLAFQPLAAQTLPRPAGPGAASGTNQLSNGAQTSGNTRSNSGASISATDPKPVAASAPNLPPPPAPSDVFGMNLFSGAFARQGAAHFNPDYVLATGDSVQIRLWGAYTLDSTLVIDPQGNVFLPLVGPLRLQGVRNADLQSVVESAVRTIFRSNVSSYANLAEAQPVRVLVGGFVQRPGLYSGTSMDGLLHYLDQAGGVDPERGSFLRIHVQRGSQVRATVNLYEFLLQGTMPSVQLATGDVVFVTPRQNTVKASGLAANPMRFEFSELDHSVANLVNLAKPAANATHLRVVRNTGTVRNVEYFPLAEASAVRLKNGDEVEFTADKKPGTITVRVEGEHQSQQEYVLPYGSRLRDVLARVELNSRSDIAHLQLFRQSVKQRQKDMLASSLRSLEAALLTARSGSSEEAKLRAEEANLTLQWVDRARRIEPLGQVLVAEDPARGEILLESGDVIRIPGRDSLVLVSGEVLFPNAVAHERGLAVVDYIRRAGGYTQSADSSRIVIARLNGRFEQVTERDSSSLRIEPGDQLLVLPKVDEKQRQFLKDITQIVYQIAVSAKVVLGL